MLQAWVDQCLDWAQTPAHLYSGCRKILRTQMATFPLNDSLQLSHAGYTSNKMRMLTKNYLHEESRDMAVRLWEMRLDKQKYGSVSFTAFNHFVKGKGTLDEIVSKKSKRASVFGPCIQSVSITWLDRKRTAVDVFYRTTEANKKLAPDLVFIRDILLKPFDLLEEPELTLHFANVTSHPMYYVTLLPHIHNPVHSFEVLKKRDKYFHDWCVKWTSRYLLEERGNGIAKFSQGLRVKKDALERLDRKTIRSLQDYLRKNGKGLWRGDDDMEEDDE